MHPPGDGGGAQAAGAAAEGSLPGRCRGYLIWAATQRAVASEGIEAGATEVTAAAVLEGSGIWEDAVDTVMIPRGKRGNEAGSSTSSSNGQQVGAGAPTALQLRGGASRKEHKARKKKARTPHAD